MSDLKFVVDVDDMCTREFDIFMVLDPRERSLGAPQPMLLCAIFCLIITSSPLNKNTKKLVFFGYSII